MALMSETGSKSPKVKITMPRTRPKVAQGGAPEAGPGAKKLPPLPRGQRTLKSDVAPAPAHETNKLALRVRTDDRVPAVGTVLKRGNGATRCECIVEAKGFKYQGKTYATLSAAASAAAIDLGLSPSQNGFVFWRLSEDARRNGLDGLERLAIAYLRALRLGLAGPKAVEIRASAERHAERIRAEIAS